MPPEPSHYHAFLLRLWRADNGGQPAWRYSLESPQKERYTFTSFKDLGAFLRRTIEGGENDGSSAWGGFEGGSPGSKHDRERKKSL